MFVKKSRIFIFVLALILLSFLINSLIPEEDRTIEAMSEKPIKLNTHYKQIDILSTNDFHGNIEENGAKFAAVMKHYINQNPEGTILVDGGDSYQGGFTSSFTYGAPVIDLFNYLNYTASVIGNHEFDWGEDRLKEITHKANYEFLAANLYNKDTGKLVDYVKPYLIKEINGVKVGLIGVFIPYSVVADISNLVVKDPVRTINEIVPKIRAAGADLVVLIGHIPGKKDSDTSQYSGMLIEIAQQIEGVDGIIGGHSHESIATTVDGIPVVEAYHKGYQIGHLRFLVNTETGEVNRVTPTIYEVQNTELDILPDKEVQEITTKYLNKLKK